MPSDQEEKSVWVELERARRQAGVIAARASVWGRVPSWTAVVSWSSESPQAVMTTTEMTTMTRLARERKSFRVSVIEVAPYYAATAKIKMARTIMPRMARAM